MQCICGDVKTVQIWGFEQTDALALCLEKAVRTETLQYMQLNVQRLNHQPKQVRDMLHVVHSPLLLAQHLLARFSTCCAYTGYRLETSVPQVHFGGVQQPVQCGL